MNPETSTEAAPDRWPAYRWWGFVALVLTAQLGLIFWLGDQGPVPPRSAPARVSFQVIGAVSNELLALTDPTLLALPHRESFAGEAWLQSTNPGYAPFLWSEPPQWLKLPAGQLGAAFHTFLTTNQFSPLQAFAWNEPEFIAPESNALPDEPGQSSVEVMGDLAHRRLLTTFNLVSWTNSEALTNTVVQVLVDREGKPYFVTPLGKGSGAVAADQFAIKEAWRTRFEPRLGRADRGATPESGLSWGELVFAWHTVAPLPTNQPAKPQAQ